MMNEGFASTRWTLVLRARGVSDESRLALSELCEAYYAPVIAFLRRQMADEETARELAHDFFARILAGKSLEHVDPQRGRFRSFLLGALKHFLADQRDRQRAAKRGGSIEHLSWQSETDTSPGLQVADESALAPDLEFDRQWAVTLLDRALKSLASEMAAAGKASLFEILKPWLMGDRPAMSQLEAAKSAGMSEGAVKVAIHRLRDRFRSIVKREIAETVGCPALVEEELRSLGGAF